MSMKSVIAAMGVGAAVGAVSIMMMPKTNPVRKAAYKAASTVEDAATRMGDKMMQKMENM